MENKLTKDDFFGIINLKGFEEAGKDEHENIVFLTTPIRDGMFDGYTIKYILTYHSTFGIRFDIDKNSIGGFSGMQNHTEKLFSGFIENEDDFEGILKCIGFTRFMNNHK